MGHCQALRFGRSRACILTSGWNAIMNTNLISIDAATRRRQAVLESKLIELLRISGERDSLEIQPMADPLDQVRQSAELRYGGRSAKPASAFDPRDSVRFGPDRGKKLRPV